MATRWHCDTSVIVDYNDYLVKLSLGWLFGQSRRTLGENQAQTLAEWGKRPVGRTKRYTVNVIWGES